MSLTERTRMECLTEAAAARTEASRCHRAAVMVCDLVVEETLLDREIALLKLAESWETQAATLPAD
jgi:hypothetical protein